MSIHIVNMQTWRGGGGVGGGGIYVHFQNGFENSKLTAFHRKLYLYNLLMINKQKFQRF